MDRSHAIVYDALSYVTGKVGCGTYYVIYRHCKGIVVLVPVYFIHIKC